MKVDCHLHTSEFSTCAKSSEAEQLDAALAYGLDAVFITDHNHLADSDHIARLDEHYRPLGLAVYGGIEVTLRQGGDDVVVLGVHDKRLNDGFDTYSELYSFAREHGGYISLCHPFRYWDGVYIPVVEQKPDAIELRSSNIGRCDQAKIVELAQRVGARLVGNSDGHRTEDVGIYHNILHRECATEREILDCIIDGDFHIGERRERIDEYNRDMAAREDVIRSYIAQGIDGKRYQQEVGYWEGYYNRVAEGKSYMI